jgi:ribonuclease HI
MSITRLEFYQLEPTANVTLEQTIEFRQPIIDLGPDTGAAGSRTRQQIMTARQHALDTIAALPEGQPVAFTDGSALGNPGPCGAAAVLYLQGMQSSPIELSKSIAISGSSYLGELWGVALALEFINDSNQVPKNFDIFVDCLGAIISCSDCSTHETHQKLIHRIHALSNKLANSGCVFTYHKVAAHINLEPNERSDKCAKKAAKEAAVPGKALITNEVTWQTCKQKVKQHVTRSWQRQWDRLDEQRLSHRCFPRVAYGKLCTGLSRAASSARVRLISGHCCLAEHLHKIRFKASPNCPCTTDRQTPEHVLLNCPLLRDQRSSLIDSIEHTYVKNKIPTHKRSLGIIDIYLDTPT